MREQSNEMTNKMEVTEPSDRPTASESLAGPEGVLEAMLPYQARVTPGLVPPGGSD